MEPLTSSGLADLNKKHYVRGPKSLELSWNLLDCGGRDLESDLI